MTTPGTADKRVPASADAIFLSASLRTEFKRVHAGIFVFYLVDALLLTGYGAAGTVAKNAGWRYGLAGCALTALVLALFWRRGGRVADLDASSLAGTLVAVAVMLTTLGFAPQVGGMMLMSIMSVLALSALQLAGRYMFALCLVLPVISVTVLAVVGVAAGVPTATTAERLLTGLWLAFLMAKASAHNAAGARVRKLVSETNGRLAHALQELERTASTDVLTALPNRRAIMAELNRALAATDVQVGSGVGVALLDIDHFKAVNDRHGHDIGDQVLCAFGQLAFNSLRATDRIGRYGGEEFLLVMPQMPNVAAAADAAERVRVGVEAHDWSSVALGLAVTVSAGVALVERNEDGATAIRRADAALYNAKRRGRNRVENATRMDESPPRADAA